MSGKGGDQTKAGAGLSYLLMFVSIIANLLVVRFISALGAEEYGLYETIGAAAGLMAVMDFGIGVTIVRYIAKYRAEGNIEAQQNFLSTSLIIYGVMAAAVLVIGYAASSLLDVIFPNISPEQLEAGWIMFILIIVNMALSLPFGAFRAAMDGYEQFVLPRILNIVRSVLRVVLVYIFIRMGYRAVMVVVVDTILNLTMQIVIMLYVVFKLKIRFHMSRFEKTLVREILTFAVFIFMTMVYDMAFWRVNKIVLGRMMGLEIAAICAYGITINVYYMRFSTAISDVFLPRVTKMIVEGADGTELTDLMIKVGRVQLLVLGLVLTGFALFGKVFMGLWVGLLNDNPAYLNTAYLVAVIIMLPLTIPLIQNIGIAILQAKNKHKFRSAVYLIIAVLNIIATILFVKLFGALGAPAATALSLVVGNVIIINIYYRKKIGIEVGRFFKETLLYMLPGLLLPPVAGYFVVNGPVRQSWLSLGLWILVYSLIYFLVNWLVTMNRFEKDLFRSFLRRIGLIRSQNA